MVVVVWRGYNSGGNALETATAAAAAAAATTAAVTASRIEKTEKRMENFSVAKEVELAAAAAVL